MSRGRILGSRNNLTRKCEKADFLLNKMRMEVPVERRTKPAEFVRRLEILLGNASKEDFQ